MLETLAQKQICLDGKKLRGVNPHSKGTQGFYIVIALPLSNVNDQPPVEYASLEP